MIRYFLIGASKAHVTKGVEGGFAQAGHGREDLISKPSKGDWIIYYSSKDKFKNGNLLQKFTAAGQVTDDKPYQSDAQQGLKPFRRNVHYKKWKEVEIRPLIENLSFIKNKKNWGFYLIRSYREIAEEDFEIIKNAMQ